MMDMVNSPKTTWARVMAALWKCSAKIPLQVQTGAADSQLHVMVRCMLLSVNHYKILIPLYVAGM